MLQQKVCFLPINLLAKHSDILSQSFRSILLFVQRRPVALGDNVRYLTFQSRHVAGHRRQDFRGTSVRAERAFVRSLRNEEVRGNQEEASETGVHLDEWSGMSIEAALLTMLLATHAVPVLPANRCGDVGGEDSEDTTDNGLERGLESQGVCTLVQEENFLEHEGNQGFRLTGGEADDDSDGKMVLVVGDLRSDDAADKEKGA
jgi:hypothetical protein